MTLTFRCPKCGQLCALHDNCAGKKARCLSCGQGLIVPSESNQKPMLTQPAHEFPVDGFFRAVFVESFRVFVNPANVTSLVFVVAVISFKFFAEHADYSFVLPGFAVNLPLGWIVRLSAWGCMFWYYMAIIRETAMQVDTLPEIDIGAGFEFIGNMIKFIYLFIVALLLAELPFIIIIAILRSAGIEWDWLLRTLTLGGLFVFPMVILILAVSDIWKAFRPDYIFAPIFKALPAYTIVGGLMVLIALLQWQTVGYGQLQNPDLPSIAIHLIANISVILLSIIAMRSVGLFFRHYSCYMPWS